MHYLSRVIVTGKQINKEIEELEAEGKRPIFTTDYYPQLAKDINNKVKSNLHDAI